jgi:hypothetical protein
MLIGSRRRELPRLRPAGELPRAVSKPEEVRHSTDKPGGDGEPEADLSDAAWRVESVARVELGCKRMGDAADAFLVVCRQTDRVANPPTPNRTSPGFLVGPQRRVGIRPGLAPRVGSRSRRWNRPAAGGAAARRHCGFRLTGEPNVARTPVLECHTNAISVAEAAMAYKDAIQHRGLASKAFMGFDGFTDLSDSPFERLDRPVWNAVAEFSKRELVGSVALIVWERPTGLQIRIGWDVPPRRLPLARVASAASS